MGLESRHDASLGRESLGQCRGKFDRWLQGATLAIALVAGGCGNGAQTPEQQCKENTEVATAGENYVECRKLPDNLVEACRGRFEHAIQDTIEGCLLLNAQQQMQCRLFVAGRTTDKAPRFICNAVNKEDASSPIELQQ